MKTGALNSIGNSATRLESVCVTITEPVSTATNVALHRRNAANSDGIGMLGLHGFDRDLCTPHVERE